MNELTSQLEYVKQHCEANRFSEALAIVEMLAASHPNNPDLLYWRARCLFGLGQTEEARGICRQLAVVYGDPRGKELAASAGALQRPANRGEMRAPRGTEPVKTPSRRLLLMTMGGIALVAALLVGILLYVRLDGSGRGWTDLFNGENLAGWDNLSDSNLYNGTGPWRVESGAIVTPGDHSLLMTRGKWGDFELQLDYKTSAKANGGVLLRGKAELQILEPGETSESTWTSGSVFGQRAPLAYPARAAGEWNRLEVKFTGTFLSARLNGVPIHNKVPLQIYKDSPIQDALEVPGPLMLQSWNGTVWFKNIRIRPM